MSRQVVSMVTTGMVRAGKALRTRLEIIGIVAP